jgi:hypothetical protein
MPVIAGFDGAEFLSDLWILHAITDDTASPPRMSYRWERVDKKVKHEYWAESRSGGGMVAYKNHLIVYGGRCRREGKVSFSDRVEVFSLGTCMSHANMCASYIILGDLLQRNSGGGK